MKSLVVFYSLSGNTRFIAEQIAAATNGDILELKPLKDVKSKGVSKYFWGGRQVFMKTCPALAVFDKDPGDYDLIFIGTPVWAGTFAPALRSFFASAELANKKVAPFCCYAGSQGRSLRCMCEELEGNDVVGEIGFKDPLVHGREGQGEKAREWSKGILAAESG